jgi:hypothetical protein
MTAVKTLHACLMDRLDVRKGSSKNLLVLNIGINIVAVNPMFLQMLFNKNLELSANSRA